MRSNPYQHLQRFAVIILIVGSLSLLVATSYAQESASILTVLPIDTHPVGVRFSVSIRLMNRDDRPLPNKVIVFFLNGEQLRRSRTDENGLASVSPGAELPVGEYEILARFEGTQVYAQTEARSTFTIRPAVISIQTFPSLAGMRFTLNGEEFVSDEAGIARAGVSVPGTYPLVALPNEPEGEIDTIIEFARWADSQWQPEREVRIRGDKQLQVGYEIFHEVLPAFVDLSGNPVDENRITSLTVKSSTGSILTLDPGETRWLQTSRIARRYNGLDISFIEYGIESIIIDGSNVVNRSQQRFFVNPNDIWEIELLLYSARIWARDAVFRVPIGTGFSLEYPDGRIEVLSFGDNDEIFLENLARGLYHLRVEGVSGMVPWTPAALSKNQEIELKVLTKLDMAAGAGLGVVGALGLLLYGRPQLLLLPITILISMPRRIQRFGATSPLFLTNRLKRSPSTGSRSTATQSVTVYTEEQLVGKNQTVRVRYSSRTVANRDQIKSDVANDDIAVKERIRTSSSRDRQLNEIGSLPDVEDFNTNELYTDRALRIAIGRVIPDGVIVARARYGYVILYDNQQNTMGADTGMVINTVKNVPGVVDVTWASELDSNAEFAAT